MKKLVKLAEHMLDVPDQANDFMFATITEDGNRLLVKWDNGFSAKLTKKDIIIFEGNPVPSLDDIQVIEDLLEEDGMSEFDNDPRDAYFNGVRAGIQTYFKHYLNGVETNKEKPNYKKAYEILSCYFDSISDEEKPKVHKQLSKLGL